MFAPIHVLQIVLYSAAGIAHSEMPEDLYKISTCEQFERGARFNPYEILDSMWKIFYFWANNTEMYPIIFSLPAKTRLDKLKMLVEVVDHNLDVEWEKASLLMEPRPGMLVVFLYSGTPGAFRALVKIDRRTKVRPFPLPLVKMVDVRLKMVDRYIGMMYCEDFTAYILARVDEMPTTEQECLTNANKFNIQLPNGQSYLSLKRLADEL